ncbi:MAG: hypothetical protein WBA74_03910, partial [Cyclobacteriaceae bacterium]
LFIMLGDNRYIDASNANISNVFADVEITGSKTVIRKVSVGEVCTNQYLINFDKQRIANQNGEELRLSGLVIENLAIETEGPVQSLSKPAFLDQPADFDLPVEFEDTNVIEDNSVLRHLQLPTDESQSTDDEMLIGQDMLFSQSGKEEASISLDEFSIRNLGYENGKNLNILTQIFAVNKVNLRTINGQSYGITELHKLFARKEIGSFETSGEITETERGKERFVGSWQVKTEEGKSMSADYDESTDVTIFQNLPVINLQLDKINFKAGDFSLSSETVLPVAIENIRLEEVVLDHTMNEVIVGRVGIDRVSANGLNFDTGSLDYSFSLKDNQRAAVNGLEFLNWKANLDDPSGLTASGNKAEINITSLLIPKLSVTLKGDDNTAGTSEGYTTAGTGKIHISYFSSGAAALSINDLAITESHFDMENASDEIHQFLESMTADRIEVKIDRKGKKSIIALNPVIKGFDFKSSDINTNLNKNIQADLVCEGELKIYEGNYESFVSQMAGQLKEFNPVRDEINLQGEADAWLVDASACRISLINMEVNYEMSNELSTRRNTIDYYEEQLNNNQSASYNALQAYKDNLQSLADEKGGSFTSDTEVLGYLDIISEANGSTGINYFNETFQLGIENGSINVENISNLLMDYSAALIMSVDANDLNRDPQIIVAAQDALNFINKGSYALAAGALGVLFAAIGARFGMAALAGGLIGFVIGAILGLILRYFAEYIDDINEVLTLLRDFLGDVINGVDYRDSLIAIVEYIATRIDIIYMDSKPYIGLVIDVDYSLGTYQKLIPLLQIGSAEADHVDGRNIQVAGLLKYLLQDNKPNNQYELDLLQKIEKIQNEVIIITNIYKNSLERRIHELKYEPGFEGFGNDQLIEELEKDLDRIKSEDYIQRIMFENLSKENLEEVDMFIDQIGFGTDDIVNGVNLSIGNVTQFLFSEISNTSLDVNLNNINLKNASDAIKATTGFEVEWLGDRDNSMTLSVRPIGEDLDVIGGNFSLDRMSGFILSNHNTNVGFGEIEFGELSYEMLLGQSEAGADQYNIGQEEMLQINGLQMAFRKEPIEKPKVVKKQPQKILNNDSKSPRYSLSDGSLELYRKLTSKYDLDHLIAVNHAFIGRDDQYFDMIDDNFSGAQIRAGMKIGFIRITDLSNNAIENFLGVLEVVPGGGTRIFTEYEPDR